MMAALPVEVVISGATRRSMLRRDGDFLYWLEQRPELQGRGVIVRWAAASGCEDVSPAHLSVRARVHEYGGAEFAVHNGMLVYSAEPDQQVWLHRADGSLQVLTSPSTPERQVRFADFAWHPSGQHIYAIREQHDGDTVTNDLVILSVQGDCQVIASGADFYAAPCVSSDGRQLAWLQWNNPQMPWDGTELLHAELIAPNVLAAVHSVAGGVSESVLQPGFSRDNRLLAISDRNGFWQLGVVTERGWQSVLDIAADCAVAPWSLGTRTWCESPSGSFWVIASRDGWQQLWRLSSSLAAAEPVALPQNGLAPQIAANARQLFLLASSATEAEALLALDVDSVASVVIRAAMRWPANVAITVAEKLKVGRGNQAIPAHFYRPVSGQGKPPLLVLCHSGPTGSASPLLQPAIQFWTSRGYAVVDINYRGSDGFGRVWRQSLLGHWAEYDVTDCLAVVEHLLGSGEIDPNRVYLRGNSAGGLTVLHMLARSQQIRAAAVRYPVVDLPRLAATSHKFEAHYLQQLVGDGEQALAAASPARHFAAIRTPMLIQQGDRDTVVPLDQARQLAAALADARIEHQLIVHPGEGHGFRLAATLAAALEAELQFFDRHR